MARKIRVRGHSFMLWPLFIILLILNPAFAKEEVLILDDFEGPITSETVDFGTGRGSTLEVSSDKNIKFSGEQSLKASYDAIAGGYMWIARAYDLDAKKAGAWLVLPQDINWQDFSAIAFYMYGSNSHTLIAFDVKDNGNEMWRFMVEDNLSGWKQIICPFEKFFARSDWQPQNSDRNSVLDFGLKSFQFEPLPVGKGVIYFDCVELIKK